jgi:deuterolysin
MKFLAGLAALVSLAAAAPHGGPTPLDVKLEMNGNSAVKATITNNGKNNLKVLKVGTIFDTSAVEKATVSANGTPPVSQSLVLLSSLVNQLTHKPSKTTGQDLEFDGLRLHVATDSLDESAFQRIPAGDSVEISFDVAEVYDMSSGGAFDIATSGILSFAAEDDTKLIGSVAYSSNSIQADIDGAAASHARLAFHQKRTRLQSDCTGTKLQITQQALRNCASLASAAQRAAVSGSASKMNEYFKSSSSYTRNTVSDVFSRVASECSSTTSGVSRYYCSDVYGACNGQVLAYTLPSASYMAYCDLYFYQLPALTRSCHAQDQATTNIHECTHLREIKGTDDYGGYGYNFVRSLSAAQNLNHADTYTLFANAIYVGC